MDTLASRYQIAYKIHLAMAIFLLFIAICFYSGILFAYQTSLPWRLIMGSFFIFLAIFIYREPEIIKNKMGKLVSNAIDNKDTIMENISTVLADEEKKGEILEKIQGQIEKLAMKHPTQAAQLFRIYDAARETKELVVKRLSDAEQAIQDVNKLLKQESQLPINPQISDITEEQLQIIGPPQVCNE